jgi:hypothetical protein
MDIFKQLKIIFIALASGQIVYFLTASVLLMNEIVETNRDFSTVLGFVVPILVVLMVVASKLLYNYLINSKLKDTSQAEKINIYRTGNITRFALIEGANLISITSYLITGDFLYAGLFVIVMGIFLINFPSNEKFMIEFGLSSNENDPEK